MQQHLEPNKGVIDIYANDDGERLTITVSGSNKATYAMNTEEATINPIEIGTGDAFWWDKDGETFVVWQQDGFACTVVADLDIEQVLEVAKNIKIK